MAAPRKPKPAARSSKPRSATHDEFLERLDPSTRAGLQRLREAIHAVQPGLREIISYQIPAFEFEGRPLIGYGAGKGHGSIYPMSGRIVAALNDDLAAYSTSKGTIRFDPQRAFPRSLLKKIIRLRLAELATGPVRVSRSTLVQSRSRNSVGKPRGVSASPKKKRGK